MRKRNSISTRSVFAITALCGILTVQIALAVDNWQLGSPTSGSSFTKIANVGGGGMTSAANGATAVFKFGHKGPGLGSMIAENSMNVTANMMGWGCTLAPPTGSTWNVSPKDAMGMYVGDHVARIEWGPFPLRNDTNNHIVTEN